MCSKRRRHHYRSFHRAARDESPFESPNPHQIFRSRHNRIWLGVCGGIADRFGWEPTLVRVLFVASIFLFAGPMAIIAYIIAAMVIPTAPRGAERMEPEEEEFWRNVSDRPRVTASGLKYTFMDLEDRLRNLERSVTSEEWRLKKAFRDLERN